MEDAGHLPVMPQQVRELLSPALRNVIVDCTVGLGGHSLALLEAAGPECRLIGIDLDEDNLRQAKERLAKFGPRVRLFVANFADIDLVLAEAGATQVDAILADLGVSSTQLDRADRGFSFLADGPLDMRMGREGPTAADLISSLSEAEMADIIFRYGEERYSRRISAAIVWARKLQRIDRTGQLAAIVTEALPAAARHGKIHPATRTFQAFRIAVNKELSNLETLLERITRLLGPAGRAAVISFHSLEDRLVKRSFAAAAAAGVVRILTPKPLIPDRDEIELNPRSRSAKLRAIERTI